MSLLLLLGGARVAAGSSVSLSGSIDTVSILGSNLTRGFSIGGNSDTGSSSGLSGQLKLDHRLISSIDAINGFSGQIGLAHSLVSQIDGLSTLSGSLLRSSTLVSSLLGNGDLSGYTRIARGIVARMDGVGDESAASSISRPLISSISANSDSSGNQSLGRGLDSSLFGQSNISGNGVLSRLLNGVIDGLSSFSATLTTIRTPTQISGLIDGTSIFGAALSNSHSINSTLSSDSVNSGRLNLARGIIGRIDGTVALDAQVSRTIDTVSRIDGDSFLSAYINRNIAARGQSDGSGVLSGNLLRNYSLQSTISNKLVQRTVWTPSQLGSAVKAWYKADTLSLNDGDAVASWTDSSGAGHDGTQSTAGKRPTYKANILNGKPVVRFSKANATGIELTNLADVVSGDNTHSWFIVARPSDLTGFPVFITYPVASTWSYLIEYNTDGDIYWGSGSGNGWYRCFDANFTTSTASLMSLVKTASNAFSFWKYGTQIVNGFDGPSGQVASTTIMSGNMLMGGYTTSSFGMEGDIAEIIYCSDALSTSDRQYVEGYLAWKYGLQANLPSDHPFKNEQPYSSAIYDDLNGAINVNYGITSRLDGSESQTGASTLSRSLISTISANSDSSGNQSISRRLDSNLFGQANIVGNESLSRSVNGRIDSLATLLATIRLGTGLVTTINSLSVLGSTISNSQSLGSRLSGDSYQNGQIGLSRGIVGRFDGVCGSNANQSIAHALNTGLVGQSDLNGRDSLLIFIRGLIDELSSLSGNLNVIKPINGLVGSVDGLSYMDQARLGLSHSTIGTIEGLTVVNGVISRNIGTSSNLDGTSNISAYLLKAIGGRGQIDIVSSLSSNLRVNYRFGGTFDNLSGINGQLGKSFGVSSSLSGTSDLTNSNITYILGLRGTSGSESSLSSGVLLRRELLSQLVGSSDLSSILSVAENQLNFEVVDFVLKIKDPYELQLALKTIADFSLAYKEPFQLSLGVVMNKDLTLGMKTLKEVTLER